MKTEQKWKICDCLVGLPEIPDNSVDLVVTDPPYLTTDLDFDKVNFDFKRFLFETNRILKPTGWFFLFCTVEIASEVLLSGYFKRKFEYVWVKSAAIPKTHNTIRPHYQHELIISFIKKDLKHPTELIFNSYELKRNGRKYSKKLNSLAGEFSTKNRLYPILKNGFQNDYIMINEGFREGTTILFYPEKTRMVYKERTAHPTQKPIGIIETILKGYSNMGGFICDPFLGSGTTLEACMNLNRNCIGFEIDPQWEPIYRKRLRLDNTKLETWGNIEVVA